MYSTVLHQSYDIPRLSSSSNFLRGTGKVSHSDSTQVNLPRGLSDFALQIIYPPLHIDAKVPAKI
jgi:hypothetical protein